LGEHSSALRLDIRFQFHSGSIQTSIKDSVGGGGGGFQFHSGSIQTLGINGPSGAAQMFQFHSGSIQTRKVALEQLRNGAVSIPLWFDSNE